MGCNSGAQTVSGNEHSFPDLNQEKKQGEEPLHALWRSSLERHSVVLRIAGLVVGKYTAKLHDTSIRLSISEMFRSVLRRQLWCTSQNCGVQPLLEQSVSLF
jgi:hypothetical protein